MLNIASVNESSLTHGDEGMYLFNDLPVELLESRHGVCKAPSHRPLRRPAHVVTAAAGVSATVLGLPPSHSVACDLCVCMRDRRLG